MDKTNQAGNRPQIDAPRCATNEGNGALNGQDVTVRDCQPVRVKIMRVRKNATAVKEESVIDLPAYKSAGAAGMDICADESVCLKAGMRVCVSTAIAIALPDGYEAQIRSRSGLALHHGVVCLNAPGTIDSDYRGEIKVILMNHGQEDFYVTRGMRIAQMVFAPTAYIEWEECDTLDRTGRGGDGFGSSGMK